MTSDTLLSTIQSINIQSLPHVTHLFASSSETACGILEDVIHATDQISASLTAYMANPIANGKLVSNLRQNSALQRSLHLSDQNIRQTIEALKKRSGIQYGEDIPLSRATLPKWCISRFEHWSSSAGMETFRDDESREGVVSFVLGGKVLVIDLDFSIDSSDPANPKVTVASVKTSYADASGAPNTEGSVSLDAFLKNSMQNFCDEVHKDEDQQNPLEATRLGSLVQDHLRYLVMLDRLAERKLDGGNRWFVDVDGLCTILENFARSEAQVVASSLSLPRASLDIFLLRSHALPLPYLSFPSISFLTHLSPRAYLSLLRNVAGRSHDENPNKTPLPDIDIPFSLIRSFLSTPQKGATMATLSLSPPSTFHLFPEAVSMPTLTARPTFSLVPGGSELEHVFPHTLDPSATVETAMTETETQVDQHTWILDFTHGGKHPGVVLSQSRMRDIELVVNPLSSMDQLNSNGMMSFGTASWVDLLLNPSNPISPERYTALYRSPSSAHPPLHLRLVAPEEPGFLLQKVPVHSMKEVWGILEVVREQCWLNEILLECHWTTEGLRVEADELPADDDGTEADLEAILSGTMKPRKIPVNVFLPSSAPDPLFDSPDALQNRRPKIVLTVPEHPPMTGLVTITVSYNETRPRGIGIQITGAMGADLKTDNLEEICRRGGTLGLPGRVWAKAQNS